MPGKFFNTGSLPLGGDDLKMEVKLFGDWAKAIRTFQGLSRKIKIASLEAQTKVCEAVVKKVKAHLRNQDLGWAPLNPKYLERKSERGLDSRALIAYGNYYHAIGVWKKGNQHLVFAGVKRGIYTRSLTGKRSKLDIATIAVIHEFSSGKKIPKRPLWNPTLREFGKKGIKDLYVKNLRTSLRRQGLPVKDTIALLKWR